MPSIFTYLDYRQYLRDALAQKRASNPTFSLRAAATKLEVNSGTLVRILNGKRSLTLSMAPRFVAMLKLRPKEARYFELLVRMQRSREGTVRRDLYEQLLRIRAERKATVPPEGHDFYNEWYYTVIRELVGLGIDGGDADQLAALLNPSVTPSQVRKALDILTELAFVERGDGGRLRVRDAVVSTGDTWTGTAVHRFQIAMMELAREAIDRFSKEERDISTVTLCLSDEGLGKAREVLRRARQELLSIEEQDPSSDRVYQVNVQVFPLTHRVGRERS